MTTPCPMVPRAPTLLLARRLGSFFKLRRRVVARFPRFWAETKLVTPRLPLARDRHLGQLEPWWRAETSSLLAWLPLATPIPGWGGGHPGRARRRDPPRSTASESAARPSPSGRDRHGVPAEFLRKEERGEGKEHPGGGEMQVGRTRQDWECRALLALVQGSRLCCPERGI